VSSLVFLESSLALNSFRISKESLVILAIGSELIGLKVDLFDVCIFLAFVPWIAIHDESFSVSCPIIATSAISDVAYFAAHIRFRFASVDARSIDL